MKLSAGSRLGPYEILAPLGAGGMGEVYRARDTRLGREVAVKVLPEELASNADRLQRFDQEARSASALNHPNIVTVHEIGRSDATWYIAMEIVDGKTLRELLASGPLPIKKSLVVAAQIADAMAAAHGSGIVHRDLKPENLMVSLDGRVKILDFGLAKIAAAGAVSDSRLPTAAGARTESGVVLGTVGYMSPEQARGSPVDFRSDQFSFGSVLYEMATGRRPFQRGSAAQTLAAIIEDEPEPIGRVNAKTPIPFRWIVERCLAKEPEARYASTQDLARDLQNVRDHLSEAGSTGPSVLQGNRHGRVRLLGASLLGALAGAVAVWIVGGREPPTSATVKRLTVSLPRSAPVVVGSLQPSLALSPDGSRLVYVAKREGGTQLWLRALDQADPTPIAGTEGGVDPFFSPDGQWVGFFAAGKLKKVSLTGAAPVTLCDAPGPGGSWGEGDTIVFALEEGLATISAAGGTPRALTRTDAGKGETYHGWPSVLPGGKTVLFSIWTGGSMGNAKIAVQSIESGDRRVLSVRGAYPRYARSGHLVFVRDDLSLMAAPFDLSRLEVTGPAVPVVDRVLLHQPSGAAQFAISSSGLLAYLSADAGFTESSMSWVDRQGKLQPVTGVRHDFEMPRISPDGERAAVGFDGDIRVYDFGRDSFTRLTFQGAAKPTWTPDGKRVAFMSWSAGPINMFWTAADGSGVAERLLTSAHAQFPDSFSPDGHLLAFMEIDPTTHNDLWVLSLQGERRARPFLRTPFAERGAAFSPDGRWLAYTSNESGAWQVYVQPYPGPGSKVQVSTDGGAEAAWSPGGGELFYRNGDKMMAVAVETSLTFQAGKPWRLFEGRFAEGPVAGFTSFDVSRDGQRFLILRPEESAAPTQVHVILDWFEDLKRRSAPAKRP